MVKDQPVDSGPRQLESRATGPRSNRLSVLVISGMCGSGGGGFQFSSPQVLLVLSG